MSANSNGNVDAIMNDNNLPPPQQQHQEILVCRPVGFHPLSLAEQNALNLDKDGDDDDNWRATALKNRAADSPTLTTTPSSNGSLQAGTTKKPQHDPIPQQPPQQQIKGQRTKSDSQRRRQTRLNNMRTIARKARFQHFAEWLIATYGKDFLSGSGLIDVAGGRGRMALELAVDRGIPCIVVDPVAVIFSVHTTRRLINLAKDDLIQATMSSSSSSSSSSSNISNTTSCNKAGEEITTTTVDMTKHPGTTAIIATTTTTTTTTTESNDDTIDHDTAKPFLLLNDKEFYRMDRQVLQYTNVYMQKVGFAFHQCLFNAEYIEQNADVWNQASMVIGMHPDEATECIVDQALLANKAFAVVPCCVFPNLFPQRTIPVDHNNDQQEKQPPPAATATTTTTIPVRTVDQFILYLCAKDPRIQTHILSDMTGSNTVVYMKVES